MAFGVSGPDGLLAGDAESLAGGAGVLDAGLIHDDDELLSAVAACDVGVPEFTVEHHGDALEDDVADGVAIGVVNGFEVVGVDHGDREGPVAAEGPGEVLLDAAVEVLAVPESGEAVDLGTLGEHADEVVHAERGSHADSEFGDVEGLHHVIDGAEVEGGDFVGGGVEAREDDDGDVAGLVAVLEESEDLEAVDAGHVEIEEDEGGGSDGGDLESFFAAGGADELDVLLAESRLEEPMDIVRVIDDEHDGTDVLGLLARAHDGVVDVAHGSTMALRQSSTSSSTWDARDRTWSSALVLRARICDSSEAAACPMGAKPYPAEAPLS